MMLCFTVGLFNVIHLITFLVVLLFQLGPTVVAKNLCLNLRGELKPSADSCSDKLPTCSAQLGINAANLAGGRRRNYGELPNVGECEAPVNEIVAENCQYTCGTCCTLPEHDCDDDEDTVTFSCAANREKCKDPTFRNLMIKTCPATCGFCLLNTDPDCVDKIGSCWSIIGLCEVPKYHDMMKRDCARTCKNICAEIKAEKNGRMSNSTTTGRKRDDPSTMVDTASNCVGNERYCNTKLYGELMSEICQFTCSLFKDQKGDDGKKTETETSTCYNERDECEYWAKNGYCGKATLAEAEENCAFSCGLC